MAFCQVQLAWGPDETAQLSSWNQWWWQQEEAGRKAAAHRHAALDALHLCDACMNLGLLAPDAHKGFGQYPGGCLVALLSCLLDLADQPRLLPFQGQQLALKICHKRT